MSDRLEVRILGCGSSGGVPRLGGPGEAGEWGDCDPGNPKNRRLRCSILVRRKSVQGETRVLVDTAPDLREQLLAAKVARLDGVLITHDHADQLHGIDDLRVVAAASHARTNVFMDTDTAQGVRRKFAYCFAQAPGSDYPPILNERVIAEPFTPFQIDGPGGPVPVLAFAQGHGRIRSLGFRFGPIAYTSDADSLDEAAFRALSGVKIWIVDALRRAPHPSHAHLARTLEWIARVRPQRAILTNMHVDMDYAGLSRELSPGIEPGFDGMTAELALE